jgi:hypothetical protein
MQLVEEFVNREGLLRYECGVWPWDEIEVVLSERQNTAGLDTDDRHTLPGIGEQ